MKKIFKKFLSIITIVAYSATSILIPMPINAGENDIIQINGVTGKDASNYITFYDGDILSGKLCIREVGTTECLNTTIDSDENTAIFDLNLEKTYEIEVIASDGYSIVQDQYYINGGEPILMPGDNIIGLPNLEGNNTLDIAFVNYNIQYPLVAYFEGIEDGILLEDNSVVAPNEFTTGNVVIKAKVCALAGGRMVPGYESCPDKREITLHCEGIINGTQIDNTAACMAGAVKIKNGFDNYGKASIHIVNELGSGLILNKQINIVTEDLIEVKAMSFLNISQSFGTAANDRTILTNNTNTGNISIFFGNSETVLYASGINVDKITNVTGTFKESTLNRDGSVLIKFPDLSEETTTTLDATILMKDGSSVKKQINLIRTAVLIQHSDAEGDDSVYAGYVVNKSYLYNNLSHNDEIFDAYLQVMLYKDDVVVGYKQIKIDDEELINGLDEGASGSMELYSEQQIPVYGKVTDDLIDGVNKVSVFLTNGPVDFDKELPSIEFGIGSGVTLEWEAR